MKVLSCTARSSRAGPEGGGAGTASLFLNISPLTPSHLNFYRSTGNPKSPA